MKLAVLGSGGWGQAMSKLLAEKGHDVSVWSHRPETTALLKKDRCSPRVLPGVILTKSNKITADIA